MKRTELQQMMTITRELRDMLGHEVVGGLGAYQFRLMKEYQKVVGRGRDLPQWMWILSQDRKKQLVF